jgi:hypothetical protein
MSLVWDNLQTFVHDWMKGLQEIVDSTAPDPGADNSMFPLASLPYKFDCTAYCTPESRDLLDGYTPWDKGYGYQPWLVAYRINLTNNNLRILNQQYLGKNVMSSPDRWGSLTNEDIELLEAACIEMYSGETIEVENAYPTNEIRLWSTGAGAIGFYPRSHQEQDIKFVFPAWDRTYKTSDSYVNCTTAALPTFNDNTGYWEPTFYYDYQAIGSHPNYSVYSKLIAVFDSETLAENVVNAISAYNTNNDIINYTKSGHEYKLYYGDNYLIYALESSNIYDYTDLFTGTNQATTAISGWHPTDPPVKTPTYDEVKHENDPGIDEDIEVDMPLSDAAFGEGLSHYYVTTVGSTVLNDISAAMSTWDINNTGKDLYRNLLSCRITKVGPIPSESGTFVIYGEELQYNGSPITITKITGNPSMDLGEYEILPKFNDFRDYAPFTKIEMFIPYCGWVSLPSHVMSSEDNPKIITGTLLCDIIAGTCKAVIKCNDTVIAEASGFTAIDVPFTGENVGMKMAGIASSITSYGNQAAKTVGSVASGAMTGGAGAGAALAGGLVGMLGSYAQMYSAFNANYTEICGKTGDGCNVAGLGKVYIKIQRPKAGDTEAPYYVPANYAHSTGFMSMRQKSISECSGLIVCANVDTSGISGATARERAEIKRLLETGIYVNLPEPEPPEP